MSPGVKVAKSAASQPLVDDGAGEGGNVGSMGSTLALTSPLPEYA